MNYLSIRWKLILPFIVLIVLVVGVLLPVTTTLIRDRVERDADRRLSQIAGSVTAMLQNAEEQALLSAQFVANLTELRFTANNEGAIGRVLGNRRDALQLQELSFYGIDYQVGDTPIYYGGPVLARRLQVSESTTAIRDALLAQALATNKPVSGIAIAPQSSQIIGVAPIITPDDVDNAIEGLVLAVFYVDEEFVAEVSDVLRVDIGLVVDNAVVAATIDSDSGYELLLQEGFIDPDGGITAENIEYGRDQRIRLLATPLILHGEPQGTVLVSQPMQELLRVRRDIQNIIIGFAIILVTMSVLFMTASIINFVRPINTLVEATRLVSQGELEQTVRLPALIARDELNDLGDNFNIMSERLQDLYTHLEERVQERTDELEQTLQQLALARDAAMEANQSKSRFLANMSHELRTPLNAIIGYSEMLEEDAVDMGMDEIGTDLNKILSAARHLLQLINDILDISKIEAGKMQLYLESFAVATPVHDICNTIQPAIDMNHNLLEVEVDDGVGDMYADLTKVRQVLLNLLSNAAKFTKGGTIRLQVKRDGANQILFRVTDSGIGMNEEQVSRLFQAFSQADESTTRKYGGTGLGLVISQRFCEMMGGHIVVESTLGEGSTFSVTLPTVVSEHAALATAYSRHYHDYSA